MNWKQNMMQRLWSLFSGFAGAAAVWGLTGTISEAQGPYDTRELFAKGAWHVELTHDAADGSLWCSASTPNNIGQSFDLTAYDTGAFVLFVFDGQWNITERPVRFLVDVDYSRWVMDGTGNGTSISLSMSEPEKAIEFIGQLMDGNAVAIFNGDERRLATFSLSGSYAAISNLMDCWDRIVIDNDFDPTDPFKSTSDPF